MTDTSVAIAKPAVSAPRAWSSALRYLTAVGREAKSDSLLYAFIICYVLAIGIISVLIGDSSRFRPFLYVWQTLSVGGSSLFLLLAPIGAIAAAVAIRRSPSAPFTELLRFTKPVLGPRVPAGALLLTVIGVFYGTFTSAKNMLPDISHSHWDMALAKADRAIHGGADPLTYLAGINGSPLAILDIFYSSVWHVLVMGLTSLIALSKAHERLRQRFLLAYFMCWVLVGNIGAAIFYSGGPCFYELFTGDQSRFSNLAKSSPAITVAEQSYLRESFRAGNVDIGTGISAFPSMHVAAATMIALLLGAIDRRLGWLGFIFVALIEIASVRLGWHYAIDGYVGICSALIVWWAAGKFFEGRQRPGTLRAQ